VRTAEPGRRRQAQPCTGNMMAPIPIRLESVMHYWRQDQRSTKVWIAGRRKEGGLQSVRDKLCCYPMKEGAKARDSTQLILNKDVNSQSPNEEYPRRIFWTKAGTNCEQAVARHSRIGSAFDSITPRGDFVVALSMNNIGFERPRVSLPAHKRVSASVLRSAIS
jgi:hypothetical protein